MIIRNKGNSIILYVTQALIFPLRLLIGWGLLVPLSYVIPKEKSIIFITRYSNNFDGNLKYLFLSFVERKAEFRKVFFLTSDHKIKKDLLAYNLPVLFFPSFKSIYRLMRAGTLIVDGNEWIWNFRYYMMFRARKIQVWHGSGMKTVGLLKPEIMNLNFIAKFVLKIIGNYPCYDLLMLNSSLQEKTRAKAFRYRELLINGLPRNDIFFKDNPNAYLVGVDSEAYNRCIQLKNEGYKVIAYCPTHRLPTDTFLTLKDSLDVKRLNDFAVNNKIIFVFKYHSKTISEHTYNISDLSNIIEYDKISDIYPLLGKCDCLITDYSSIFVDYLLLNKPVIFFPFDQDHYIKSERALQFEYEEVTPGKKCYTHDELELELKKAVVNGIDEYGNDRKLVLKKFFDTADGKSCDRIAEYIKKKYEIKET